MTGCVRLAVGAPSMTQPLLPCAEIPELPRTLADIGATRNPSVNQSAHFRPRAESPATKRGVTGLFQTADFGKERNPRAPWVRGPVPGRPGFPQE